MSKIQRVRSFESFSSQLQERQPSHVIVQANRAPARGLFSTVFTPTLGRLGHFEHGLLYTVRDPNAKKPREHIEPLFTAFQSERGFGDAVNRSLRTMAVLLAGEVRVEQLSLALPDTQVYLGDQDLNPMTEELLRTLHEQAQEHQLAVPQFVV